MQQLTADALDAESLAAADDPAADSPVSVNELGWEFMQQKLPTYKPSERGESSEATCYRLMIRILREASGESPAKAFGPRKLRQGQQRERDMPVPADPGTDFLFVEPRQLFGLLETFFNGPAAAGDLDDL